jgi:hypothetical protein
MFEALRYKPEGRGIDHIRIVVYEFQPDDGPPRKGPKQVADFFNNFKKFQLCYDGHLYT